MQKSGELSRIYESHVSEITSLFSRLNHANSLKRHELCVSLAFDSPDAFIPILLPRLSYNTSIRRLISID